MVAPKCRHCGVEMKLYEIIQKADGPYGRFKCPTNPCARCFDKACTERVGQSISIHDTTR
jgi:hypothetical protein